MHMNKTVQARHELAIAEARVKFAAQRMSEPDCGDEEKFKILWNLAFLYLSSLEAHRVPSA